MGNTETAFSYAIAADTDLQYVPFAGPKVDGEGTDEFGQIAVAREQSYNGNMHIAGFWKVQPSTSPLYAPVGDESGYVIEGSATIEFLETGEKVELKAGDLYTFAKGTLQRWTVHEPFKKFVVVAEAPPPAERPANGPADVAGPFRWRFAQNPCHRRGPVPSVGGSAATAAIPSAKGPAWQP